MNSTILSVSVRLLAAVLLVTMAGASLGCRGRVGPKSVQVRDVESVAASTADGKAKVHRYTVDRFTYLREQTRLPFVIPTKAMVVMTKSRADQIDPKAPVKRLSRKEDGKLFLDEGASAPTVTALLGLPADDYNELRITMRVSAGKQSVLTWTTDLEPSSMRSQGLVIPIFADGELHTYRVPLGGLGSQTWVGTVKSVVLTPSDAPANIVIESMELGFAPPDSPSRITIAAETHEAAIGTQPPWNVVLPANAMFSACIGMPEETWSHNRDGKARFVAIMDTESEKGVLLIDQALTPKSDEAHREWLPFKANLGKYSGQKVQIKLAITGVGDAAPSPACWGDPMIYGAEPDTGAVPVILISCDTLAAGHLSCYGYPRETSPYLDAFAKEAVVFENAITPETWTLPSHASMFTGLYPKHHGVTPNANLAESTRTLPEVLRDGGYLNGGYIGFTFWLYPWRGFAHGFDVYNTPSWRFRGIFDTHRLATGWLDTYRVPNLFLFLHNFDVHSKPAKQYDGLPYGPDDPKFLHFANEFPNPPTFVREGRTIVDAEAFLIAANEGKIKLTQEEHDYCVALYDDCIRMIDSGLNDLFQKLKELELYDRALIIVTADHGEEFGQHGTYGHGNVYEPALHIPMIVKFPNGEFAGTRFTPVVELVDVMPTILDVTNLPVPDGLDGKSMYAMLKKEIEPKTHGFSQRFMHRTLREAEWKLVRTGADKLRLFNVALDPEEKNDVAAANPDVVSRMQPLLDDFYKVNPEGWHIAFTLPGEEWKGNLTISTEDIVESAELLGGQDVAAMSKTERGVTLNLSRMNRVAKDELVVRTVGTQGRVSLTMQSQSDFSVALGDQPVATGDAFKFVLDPTSKAYPQPADFDGASESARFRIWYVPQTNTRSAAQHLSPEAQAELKALGYTGE